MKHQVVVGSRKAVGRWCEERHLHPLSVTRLFERGDERHFHGMDWDDVQVTQLEGPPARSVTELLSQLAARTRTSRSAGVFVVFEGGEGAGKSTQLKLLADALWRAGRDVVLTREPGGTQVGQRIRSMLLRDGDVDPLSARTEALLFAADRSHHVDATIRPALARGAVVLSDRYVDSSLAYQGAGRKLDMGQVRSLSEFATAGLVPDLTVLLDVPVAVGLSRVALRGPENRLDREDRRFHERVREQFLGLAAADPGRYLVVDAELAGRAVAEQVQEAVGALVDANRVGGSGEQRRDEDVDECGSLEQRESGRWVL